MKKTQVFEIIFFVVATFAMIGMFLYGTNHHVAFGRSLTGNQYFWRGRVVEVISDTSSPNDMGVYVGFQELVVELLEGPRGGETIEVFNSLMVGGHGVVGAVDLTLIVAVEEIPDTDILIARVFSHHRSTSIYVVILSFIGLLGLIFGKNGLRSAFSLIFTFITIVFFLVPLSFAFARPAFMTLIAAVLITVVTLISVMGLNKKTLISTIGTFTGIVCYCLLYLLISALLKVSGMDGSGVSMLTMMDVQNYIQINELLFSSILIASLGAIMDVPVSLSTAIFELHKSNPTLTRTDLFKAGMQIGKDLIGSTANTLILAFTGVFFTTIFFIRFSETPFNMFINGSDIAIEVLRAVSAASAMALTAPATAIIAAYYFTRKNKVMLE